MVQVLLVIWGNNCEYHRKEMPMIGKRATLENTRRCLRCTERVTASAYVHISSDGEPCPAAYCHKDKTDSKVFGFNKCAKLVTYNYVRMF